MASKGPSMKIYNGKKKYIKPTLDLKLEVINRKKNGERIVDISQSLGIPCPSIYRIIKKLHNYKTVTTMLQDSEISIPHLTNYVRKKVEQRLITWIKDCNHSHEPVSLALIQMKALSLHKDIRKEIGKEVANKVKDFGITKKWYHHFQKRYQLNNANADKNKLNVNTNLTSCDKNLSSAHKNETNVDVSATNTDVNKNNTNINSDSLYADSMDMIPKNTIINADNIKTYANSAHAYTTSCIVANKNCIDANKDCTDANADNINMKSENINNVNMSTNSIIVNTAETNVNAASTNVAASGITINAIETGPIDLELIISEEGYNLKQIFNASEMALSWKRKPDCIYHSLKAKNTSVFKMTQDRVALLVGGNANGDKKLKPLLVYRSENPQAQKCIDKSLPVIWKLNKNAMITKQIICWWFLDYFVPEVKKYCDKENLDFKILLILDNTTSHLIDFRSLCRQVKVIFLPFHILKPMHQGVIKAFKSHYVYLTFKKLINETDVNDKSTVEEFWKNFSIFNSIELLGQAWELITSHLMNSCWKNLYPDAVQSFEEFDICDMNTEIVTLARIAGLHRVNEKDVEELLESHFLPLPSEELIELIQQTEERSEEDDVETKSQMAMELTVQGLQEAFAKLEEVISYFKKHDPLYERALKFEYGIKNLLSCYQKILTQKLNTV